MISVKVDSSKISIYLDKLTPAIMRAIEGEIRVQSQGLVDFMKTDYLTGGTSASKLAVRTGHLRRSVALIPTIKSEDKVMGGMGVGEGIPYAKVHINDFGKVTTISAKGKLLTIPMGPARTAGGASSRANAESWGRGKGGLFAWKSPTGKQYLVKAQGKKIIPYFALVRSVQVKARVDPSLVLKAREQKIVSGVKAAISSVMK